MRTGIRCGGPVGRRIFCNYVCPVDPIAASNTKPMLRGLICADFVCGVGGVLFCCKVCAGLVINATAIIPQTDKALRVLLAVGFRVLNRLLDIDFRLDRGVNGAHLTFCAVALTKLIDADRGLRVKMGAQGLEKPTGLRSQVVVLRRADFSQPTYGPLGGPTE
jgi:hypothetical protein